MQQNQPSNHSSSFHQSRFRWTTDPTSIVCGVTPAGSNSVLFIPPITAIGAVAVHTIAHLATAALVAWVVYDFIGLAILRRSWINLDLIWSFSLLVAGISLFLHG